MRPVFPRDAASRSPRRAALLALALGVAWPALGAGAAEDRVARLAREVEVVEAERAQLVARRDGLEAQSRRELAEIDQLKSGGRGLGREVRLPQLLAASRQRADELSSLAATLRERDARLTEARRGLLQACREALADPQLPPERRLALARLEGETERAALAAARAGAPELRVAPPAALDPLAGPAELVERADRLRDDEDKLRREAARLAQRIDRIDEKRRLRERAAQLGDDLFVEGAVGRRVLRTSPQNPLAATPAPDKVALPGFITSGGGATGGMSESTSALRGVVDPTTLDQLRRAEAGADLDAELAALQRARQDLDARAQLLEKHEAELRRRAAQLRGTK